MRLGSLHAMGLELRIPKRLDGLVGQQYTLAPQPPIRILRTVDPLLIGGVH